MCLAFDAVGEYTVKIFTLTLQRNTEIPGLVLQPIRLKVIGSKTGRCIITSEMCHRRCVDKLIGRGIKSITQQVYLLMFIRG